MTRDVVVPRSLPNASAVEKMSMHLRALYSASAAASLMPEQFEMSPTDRQFADTFDHARLETERRHRITQLARHCKRQCAALWQAAGEARMMDFVRAFADHTCFWERRGRNMAENFCLFAASRLEAESAEGLADLARLVGIIAGLSSAPDRPSPWPAARFAPEPLRVSGVVASEAFVARFELLDSSSRIELGGRRAHAALVFVLYFHDRTMIVGAEETA